MCHLASLGTIRHYSGDQPVIKSVISDLKLVSKPDLGFEVIEAYVVNKFTESLFSTRAFIEG